MIEKKNGRLIDLEPAAGLNVELYELQRSLLNPTSQDMIGSDIIDQAKGEKAKNEEAKQKWCFMTGNTNRYSWILNDEKSIELIVDYNDMAVGLVILNTEKYSNVKELEDKNMEEAADFPSDL